MLSRRLTFILDEAMKRPRGKYSAIMDEAWKRPGNLATLATKHFSELARRSIAARRTAATSKL